MKSSKMSTSINGPSHLCELGSRRFVFQRPDEAPVFTPTEEEFKDPLTFIKSITPIGEKYGICKIIPPKNWQPPFTLETDKTLFTPRVQTLNELEANSRVKLNFLNKISFFWERYGRSFKTPLVDSQELDLYTLHNCVQKMPQSQSKTFWLNVADKMGYSNIFANSLKFYYDEILRPFDEVAQESSVEPIPSKRIKHNHKCINCHLSSFEDQILLCNECADRYHIFCHSPIFDAVPKGVWRCAKCVVKEISQIKESFVFTDSEREYNIREFGEMADEFKTVYFNAPVKFVSIDRVENEFWRIASNIFEDVTVEYGADLQFPKCQTVLAADEPYLNSPWLLSNLPLLKNCVLGYINGEISGIKEPWMYVGMCFAAFCWHTEDHWTYSINYLHWGEPKTWYGVPGSAADDFESVIKQNTPELFKNDPDLLSHLVTNINPNILMSANVPVYRTDQCAGEFVITFPRAYHAGFNQGFNFAEAVNFATDDWIKKGRDFTKNSMELKKACVFSHDELICRMALQSDTLDFGIAVASYLDIVTMFETEKKLRLQLFTSGVKRFERKLFELLLDNVRQCKFCKTTCFLSALACDCSDGDIVCLFHFNELCKCTPSKKKLLYRYNMDELFLIVAKLKKKADIYENWLVEVRKVLHCEALEKEKSKVEFVQVQKLMQEATTNGFPACSVFKRLQQINNDAMKYSVIIKKLNLMNNNSNLKVSLGELLSLSIIVDDMVCLIPEQAILSKILITEDKLTEKAIALIKAPMAKNITNELKELIMQIQAHNIESPNLCLLQTRLEHASWWQKVERILSNSELQKKSTFFSLKRVLTEGMSLVPDSIIEQQLIKLQIIIEQVNNWEKTSRQWLEKKENMQINEITMLLKIGDEIRCQLPSYNELKECLREIIYFDKENDSNVENAAAMLTPQKKIKNLEMFRDEDNAELSDRTFSASETSDEESYTVKTRKPRKSKVLVINRRKLKSFQNYVKDSMFNTNKKQLKFKSKKSKRKKNGNVSSRKTQFLLCDQKDCQQPTGSTVDWVQCDYCNKWFHIICVGLKKREIRPDVNFICSLHPKLIVKGD